MIDIKNVLFCLLLKYVYLHVNYSFRQLPIIIPLEIQRDLVLDLKIYVPDSASQESNFEKFETVFIIVLYSLKMRFFLTLHTNAD